MWESQSRNLLMGVSLLLNHPDFDRSCGDCQKWLYDEEGQVQRRPARTGLPVLRPPGTPLPCDRCPKIPKGEEPSPVNAVEMTEQNRQAYWHYLECRAVGSFPDDPIVRRNARTIRQVHDQYDRQPMELFLLRLGSAKRE